MSAAEGFGPVDPAEAAELAARRRERRARERRNDNGRGADDGRPLASDHRRRATELRRQDEVLSAAYDEGTRGVRTLDEDAWPPELLDEVCTMHAAGLDELARSRRAARWELVRSALCWLGRHLAPRTARRLRRMRRRVRRVRALTGEVRHR